MTNWHLYTVTLGTHNSTEMILMKMNIWKFTHSNCGRKNELQLYTQLLKAVTKRKPETNSGHDLYDTGAVLYQLS